MMSAPLPSQVEKQELPANALSPRRVHEPPNVILAPLSTPMLPVQDPPPLRPRFSLSPARSESPSGTVVAPVTLMVENVAPLAIPARAPLTACRVAMVVVDDELRLRSTPPSRTTLPRVVAVDPVV